MVCAAFAPGRENFAGRARFHRFLDSMQKSSTARFGGICVKDRETGGLHQMTQGAVLSSWANIFPHKTAAAELVSGRTLSFSQLEWRARRLARGLAAVGVKSGDHVAYLLNDRLEVLELLYALGYLGAVWTPVNTRMTPDELARQLEHAHATTLIYEEACAPLARAAASRLRLARLVGLDVPDAEISYASLFSSSGPDAWAVADTSPAGLLYTSGTTGIPKGVVHTHQTLYGWNASLIATLHWGWRDRFLNPYPLFHMGGIGFALAAIQSGAGVWLLGKFDPRRFLDGVEEAEITTTILVPTMLHAVVNLPPEILGRRRWASLAQLATTSAPLMAETRRKLRRVWPHLSCLVLYSATEAIFSVLMPEEFERKADTVGRPAFGMSLAVRREDGRPADPGEAGLIYSRGVSVFSGYFQNPEANADFQDGWVTCRDVGYFDEEGYLHLVDRLADLINSGGEKISSIEVEQTLTSHPDVREAAVIGVFDPVWSERIHAVVSLYDHASPNPDALREWCRKRLAGFKVPKSFAFVDQLPKSPTGKILKRELRKMLGDPSEKEGAE